jgi:hypothetical protein
MNNNITLSRINSGLQRPFPSAGAKISVLIINNPASNFEEVQSICLIF